MTVADGFAARLAEAIDRGHALVDAGAAPDAAAILRDTLQARRGAVALHDANAAAALLVRILQAGAGDAARGLAVTLYGQGARQPMLILRAFEEFIDAGNPAQAARFVPYVVRMPGPAAALASARLHLLQDSSAAVTGLLRMLAGPAPALSDRLQWLGARASMREQRTLDDWRDFAADVDGALDALDAEADALPAPARTAAAAAIAPAAQLANHVGAERQLCARLRADLDVPASAGLAADTLAALLAALQRAGAFAGLDETLAAARRVNPAHAGLALVAARLMRRQLAPAGLLVDLLAAVPEGARGYAALRDYVDWTRQLDGDPTVSAASAPTAGERLARVDGDPYAEALAPLRVLANATWRHGESPDADALASQADAALQHVRRHLAGAVRCTLADAVRAGDALAHAATPIRPLAIYAELPEHAIGPAYGSLDATRYRIVHRALQQHRHALLADAVDRALADGAPVSLRDLVDAAEGMVSAALEADEPAVAEARVDQLLARCGDAARATLLQLRERCRLSAMPPALHGRAAHSEAGITDATRHPLRSFGDLPGAASRAAEARITGTFTTVDVDGTETTHPHSAPDEAFVVVEMRDVVVRDSWLLLDGEGALLRPPASYRLSGDFPYSSPGLLVRGRHAATLAPAARRRHIDEPLLVLANADLLHHANYFHWTVHLLARIHWAHRHGWLARRRLLLPAETRPWMDASLRLLGIPDERLVRHRIDEAVHVADAAVVAPLAHAPAAMLAALRQGATEAVGHAPRTPGNGRLLYLSRRGAARRTLPNEARLCEIAAAHGFDVVQPETSGIAAQVALFAGARGIAAPAGAALANAVYAPAGTRTLSLAADVDNPPTFVELSIALGQPHRVLFGATDHRLAAHTPPDDLPYRVDEDAFAAQLRWVAADGD